MKLKIERPDWDDLYIETPGKGSLNMSISDQEIRILNRWFDQHVEPINKMLAEGVEVYGYGDDKSIWQKPEHHDMHEVTHKALLICIEPLEKKCPECGK